MPARRSATCSVRSIIRSVITGSFFTPENVHSYQELYFEHLALSAESGLFDTLAHPDLIKNESPADWDFVRIRPHLERALDRIAATGVAMELNTSGVQKALPEMNPSPAQLSMMWERGIPVVIGADAHVPERVGDGYAKALRLLQQAGYSEVSYFLDRKRQTVPIQKALAQLQEPVSPGENEFREPVIERNSGPGCILLEVDPWCNHRACLKLCHFPALWLPAHHPAWARSSLFSRSAG